MAYAARHQAVTVQGRLNQKEPGAGTGTARHTEASFSASKSRAGWKHLNPSWTSGCTPKTPRDTFSCANTVTWPRIVSVVTARAHRSSPPAAAAGLTLPHACLGLSLRWLQTPQTTGKLKQPDIPKLFITTFKSRSFFTIYLEHRTRRSTRPRPNILFTMACPHIGSARGFPLDPKSRHCPADRPRPVEANSSRLYLSRGLHRMLRFHCMHLPSPSLAMFLSTQNKLTTPC